jgi:hypothetical protein
MDLSADREGEEFVVTSTLLPPGKQGGKIALRGRVKAEGPVLDGKVSLDRWPLTTLGPILQELVAVQPIEGRLTGEIPVHWRVGTPFRFQSQLNVQRAALRIGGASGPLLTDLEAEAAVGTEEVRFLRPASFSLGKTEWVLAGRLPLDGSPVSLTAATGKLYLESLTQDLHLAPKLEASGEGKAAFDVTGTAREPVLHGVAALGPSRLGRWELGSVEMEAQYSGGVLRLTRATGRLYDGELTASGSAQPSQGAASPLTVALDLKQIRTRPLAELLGMKDWDGRTDLNVAVGGTVGQPTLFVTNTLAVSKTLHGKEQKYLFKNELHLTGTDARVSTRVNDDVRFESHWVEREDRWDLLTLSLKTKTSKGSLLRGQGSWPKKATDPIDIKMSGERLEIGSTPFLREQFPGVRGVLTFEVQVSGTRQALKVDLGVGSPALRLGLRKPEVFRADLHWMPQSLGIERLAWGKSLKAQGTVGLTETAILDAQVEAEEVPLALLGGLFNVEPEGDEASGGVLTGRLKLLGTRGKPLLDGKAVVTGYKAGAWALERIEAEMGVKGDRVELKRLHVVQTGGGKVTATGWLQPGTPLSKAQWDFDLQGFKLGGGPRAKGHAHASLQTEGMWRKSASGRVTLPDLVLSGEKSDAFVSPPLTADLDWKDGVAGLDLRLGGLVQGKARWDTRVTPSRLSADLTLLSADLGGHPLLAQWIPKDWGADGLIQGTVTIPEGPANDPRLSARLSVVQGHVKRYAFDNLSLQMDGDKRELRPQLVLTQGQARYELGGVLTSTQGPFASSTVLKLEGPFVNESFANLLKLMGLSFTGHSVSGKVSGVLGIEGTLGEPRSRLDATGENLRWDETLVPSAELHATFSRAGLALQKSRVGLGKGEAILEDAHLTPRVDEPGSYLVVVKGVAKDLPLSALQLNGRMSLDGVWRPSPKDGEDLFAGAIAMMDASSPKATSFGARCSIRKGVVTLLPSPGGVLLRGVIDFSKKDRVTFNGLHGEAEGGTLDIEGSVDLHGPCDLTLDARGLRIERVGQFVSRSFALTGTGNTHLLFKGTMDDPQLSASFNLSGGKFHGLSYDLLDGTLVSRGNVLRVGSAETPLTLSRSGAYAFTLYGTMPFALSSQGWGRLRNKEMDLTASMPKGDLGLFMLAGFAKHAEGPMDFAAKVTGTLDHPVVTADLDFHGGRIVPKMIATSVDDIQGRIKVRANQVAVEDLNARIGQGRVFFWTPPAEESKMVLDGFAPKYYDLRVRTVTERGVLLNIPAIMRPGEWGEMFFYGSRREDPLLIVGPSDDPHVVGTALLDTGHYTFPPVVAKDASGKEITYKELAVVNFQLTLVAGRECWYSNDFSTNYLEMKVNPESRIIIEGKDANKTPQRAGIQSRGTAGSRDGWLRYLNREFKVQQATMHIPKGEMPLLTGRATDHMKDVDIVTQAGTRTTDVELWVDFEGPIGAVDFKLGSNPRFASSNDPEANQQLLLSYVLFGKDMTGYTREDLGKAYEQHAGKEAEQSVLEAMDRVAAITLSRKVRRLTRSLGGIEVNVRSGLFQEAGRESSSGAVTATAEGSGNTLASGNTRSLASVELKKYLDQRFAVVSNFGLLKDNATDRSSFQKQVGLDYDLSRDLTLNTRVGQNDEGVAEQKVGFSFRTILPDIKKADKADKTPPKLERFDVYTLGPGALQVLWTTDEVSKAELSLLDSDGEVLRRVPVDKGFEYYHEVVIEKLEPDTDYGVQLLIRDLNGNLRTSPTKDVSTPPS